MKFLNKLTFHIVSKIINTSPSFFLRCLMHDNLDRIVLEINTPKLFNWKDVKIPEYIIGFEDLSFLFWTCPLNRGMIRQDIDEAALLFKIIQSIQNPKGIEIGRFNGGSTVLLASAVGSNGKLISIDIKPQNDVTLSEILKELNIYNRVELIVGDANNIKVNDYYDFVFIDGDHTYEGAKKDHNKWGKLIKLGGYLIHHDMGNGRKYSTQWNDLAKLKKDIVFNQQKDLKIIKEIGSMVVFQRISETWHAI